MAPYIFRKEIRLWKKSDRNDAIENGYLGDMYMGKTETSTTNKANEIQTEAVLDKLEALSKTINKDFEWAMDTSLVFENHGIKDAETIGFLKGVAYCTEMYLDILEREKVKVI